MPLPPAPSRPGDRLVVATDSRSARARPSRSAEPAGSHEPPTAKATPKTTASLLQTREPAEKLSAPTGKAAKPASYATPTRAPPASSAALAAVQPERSAQARPAAKPRRKAHSGPAKLFVLDTNVLMHDPMCLFRFEEHDVFLPMIVLEELDSHKKGMTEVARNARQTSRSLDGLAAADTSADIAAGLRLDGTGYKDASGRLFFQTQPLAYTLPTSLPQGKADNQILGVVHALAQAYSPREVVLVSKDINMRVKSRALGLNAEDYQNDKTLADDELLYSGMQALPADFWTTHDLLETWKAASLDHWRVSGPLVADMLINQFVYSEAPGEHPLYGRVVELRGDTAVIRALKDYTNKHGVWGVAAKNREQNFALNMLMDPEVDFVTLAGTAGTGKTLMALASGLSQVLEDRRYSEIIMTRATVSVGEDIGFLPGTEEEKMGPWMGALDDNLEFLSKTENGGHGEWGRAASADLIRSRIKIKSMNFMRGRTFMNKWVIIDEAQNLTPKQMKTLITRAGPGTKIVCMGNLAQIDTPYLTEGSSGMTFAVDKFKGWPHGGHITLARGERSRLADFASEVL